MESPPSSDFKEISTTFFLRIQGVLPFDVFIRRAASAYSMLFKKGDLIDQERVRAYSSQKGVQSLFIHALEFELYLTQFERTAKEVFASLESSNPEEVIGLLSDMAQYVAQDLKEKVDLSDRTAGFAVQTIKGCLALFEKDLTALIRLLQYVGQRPYALRHALAVTIFSLLLARADQVVTEKSLMGIGIGALFHDIGMGLLSFEEEEKESLTPLEWREIKTHPQLGAKILDGVAGIPEEARLIVLQHHEQPNGQGYPEGLRTLHIYPPAKIVAIADAFAALISERPFRAQKFSRAEAIELLRKDQGKYDRKLVDKLAVVFSAPVAAR